MKEIWIGIGIIVAAVAALIGPPLLNIAIGPSVNTIELCKELDKEGYLADECFDKFGLKLECYRRGKFGVSK